MKRGLFSKQSLLQYGPAAAMTALIPTLSLLPARFFRQAEAPLPALPGLDKLAHALMYAALTAAYLHALPPSARLRLGVVLRLALICALIGLAMELCQKGLTRTRSMDPLDALANAAGAFAYALPAYAWARRQAGRRPGAHQR